MSQDEKDARELPDSSFDQDQQHMFGNENQSAPDATRPHAGTRAAPILPGSEAAEAEASTSADADEQGG